MELLKIEGALYLVHYFLGIPALADSCVSHQQQLEQVVVRLRLPRCHGSAVGEALAQTTAAVA